MNKLFFELYNDLHNSSYKENNLLKKFFFNSKQHVILIFYISSQKNLRSTLEDLCYNISPKIISRSTIQNILKEGVKINFFEKKINTNDKRAKYYLLTTEAQKLIEEWALNQKNIFQNIKVNF